MSNQNPKTVESSAYGGQDEEDYIELYPKLAEKAKEWARREGLSDEFAYGALNAMWNTVVGDMRQRDLRRAGARC